MNIFDIQGLIDNTSTIYTKIEILPKVSGESIITLTNDDSIKEWVYSDLRNVEKEGFIGQFVARTLDGELQDIDDTFNIEDREIVLYLGISSNHTAELITQDNNEIITQSNEGIITEQGADILTYYKLGNFFVEKPESDEVRDNTKFQAMDYTILFNTPFNADFKDSEYIKSFNEKIEDEETVTALWLTQYTCKQVGVTLGTTTFRNSSFVIDSNQFDSGYTCRDVIKSIAKLAVTWARIGWDNKLYLDFDKQTETSESYNVITNDNYYELTTQKDVYGEVNRILMGSSIVIGNSAYVEDAQSITNNGLTELDIYDNPILYTQELRNTAISSASAMLGLMYQPVEIETTGHPWLLGNELITIEDMEDNHLTTYPLDRIITYNGHIRTKISSMAKTETESTYSYQGVENNEKEIKRSRVELDRQNQTLTSVMERTTNNESNISTLTQNVSGISANITSMSGDIISINGSISSIQGDITSLTSDLSSLSGDVTDLTSDLNGLSVDFEDFYDNEYVQTIQDLQDQIDGVIEFWTGNDVPTLNNAPANAWTTEALKQEHIGDVYIVLSGQSQGANYRFVKDGNTWKWLEISDSQIGAVRELAQSAMNLANVNALDIVDLKATDVSLQASIDGISASVTTLETNVDELEEGFEDITTAEKTVVGNPLLIADCGEYLIKNLTLYGKTEQASTPTIASPVDVKGVAGEHSLLVRSNNMYHVPNNTQFDNGLTVITNDNIITIDGAYVKQGSTFTRFYLDEEQLSLTAGTYTMTCLFEGTTSASTAPYIRFVNNNSSDTLATFYNVSTSTASSTFTISETKENCEVWIDVNVNVTYDNYKIKIQLERGSTSTDYSNIYVEPSTYTYNLNDLVLHGIGNYKDYITYNITDEIWYLHKNIKSFAVNSDNVSGSAESSDTRECIIISNGYRTDMKSVDNSIYCNEFSFKGAVTSENNIPDEEGLYVRFQDVYGESRYYVYLSVLKTTLGSQPGAYISPATVKNWVGTQNISYYYVQETTETTELTDDALIADLDNIRNTAKLYKTHMIVQDIPSDNTTVTGDIGINYLTDTVFNSIYASRSELKITQNGISAMVSETVNAVVENIDNRVTDVANTLEQNSKDLNDKINNLSDGLEDYAKKSSLVTVTNSVENIITSLNEQILVTQQIKENGVEQVKTTTGFTFDRDGLTIDKSGADTKTVVDEDGMTVYSKNGSENSVLLNVDSQGVQTENLHVRTYTQIGSHSRLQDYEDGTAIFYIE